LIKLNDHYFIAWLNVVKGYKVEVKKEGIYVHMTPQSYSIALSEYSESYKPILKEIRAFIKKLNHLTRNV